MDTPGKPSDATAMQGKGKKGLGSATAGLLTEAVTAVAQIVVTGTPLAFFLAAVVGFCFCVVGYLRGDSRRRVRAVAIAGSILAVIVAAMNVPGLSGGHPTPGPDVALPTLSMDQAPSSAPASVASNVPSASLPDSFSPAAVQPSNDTPLAPQPEPVYLTTLPMVDYDTRNGTALWDTGTYSTNGTAYPHSIAVNAGCQNGDSGDFWLEYNLSRAYTTFTVTAGLDDVDSSGVTMSYTVSVDGNVLASGMLSAGMSKSLHLALHHGLRLRLSLHDSKYYYCGSGWSAYLVWGQPTVIP